jgi:hypothetical protein
MRIERVIRHSDLRIRRAFPGDTKVPHEFSYKSFNEPPRSTLCRGRPEAEGSKHSIRNTRRTSHDRKEDHRRKNMYVLGQNPIPGALAVLAEENRLEEVKDLETNRQVRIWKVRGVVSDFVPLAADATEAITRPPVHKVFLNENPLIIYLHKGGWNAVYYDLVANDNRLLKYIEVRVETDLPSNALVLSRGPLNELLDHLATQYAPHSIGKISASESVRASSQPTTCWNSHTSRSWNKHSRLAIVRTNASSDPKREN